MSSRNQRVLAITLAATAFSVGAAQAAKVTHLYNLSNFNGSVPFNWVSLAVDPQYHEVFVAGGLSVHVFNASGMETYRFAQDVELGRVLDLAVDEDGYILFLSDSPGSGGAREIYVSRCDYRGEFESRIELSGVPATFASFRPDHLRSHDGRLFLVSYPQMLVMITDAKGVFQEGYDLASMLDISPTDRLSTDLGGFNVDRAGNMLFTIPVAFRAYVFRPGGEIREFGRGGSIPGSFGVVAGIASTDDGDILVADRGRSVVLVFDQALDFVTEFGRRGNGPENLIRPDRVESDGSGRIYVTQLRDRGVAVFSMSPSQ